MNLGFTSRSRHLRSICIVPWFARSPRVAWRTWWRSVVSDRARARARRLVVRVACGGCDVVVRGTRSDGGVGTLCFAVRFLHLRVTNPVNPCEVFSWARDGLGGSGAFLCAHRAVGEDPTSRPTSGTSTHYFHTRTPHTRRAAARPPLSDICRSASQIGEAKSFPYVVQHWV